MNNTKTSISIIIAAVIVAGAIVFSGGSNENQVQKQENFGNNNSISAQNVRPVDENIDHVLGGTNAKVYVIEYSDFECPFCARFHPTLDRVVSDFGGEVGWVYRHLPLTSIHSKAQRAAVASECAASIGGGGAFWEFADELFKNQRSLGDDLYTEIAVDLGLDKALFESCLDSGEFDSKVASDMENAAESGGKGTPFTIVLTKGGETFPFSGALPYERVRSIVEEALGE
jgi:protein-disulfide isomerase